jgi:hypothetical protein
MALPGSLGQDARHPAMTSRRGSCSWDVDHPSWVVTPRSAAERTFYRRPREEGFVWCLVWFMGNRSFLWLVRACCLWVVGR